MKKFFIIAGLAFLCVFYSCLVRKGQRQALYDLQQRPDNSYKIDSISTLPAYKQEQGNPALGYQYLLHGNLFNTGVPYSLYKFIFKTTDRKALEWAGYNDHEVNDLMVFENGEKMATPGCFHCHAESFNGKLVIGLGNSYSKFQVDYSQYLKPARFLLKSVHGKNSKEWKGFENFHNVGTVVAPEIILQAQGPNPAHRISHVMASHRDPVTFKFRGDTSYFDLPDAVVPTDIPALWLTKRKNAWTYDGLAQGNAAKQFMISTILTLKDTSEARTLYNMMKDIWAYLQTLEPPKYPYPVDKQLVMEGKEIFTNHCSSCHGTYGEGGKYPNKLIPEKVIGTDSLLLKYYSLYRGYENWYNKSWFATTTDPAITNAQYGYVCPPLDGVWVTAPYFHNGSVPTLEGVLNSDIRPRYWKRNFQKEEYDYKKLGWKYKKLHRAGGKKSYNTDIPGYGNYGHYFGDVLTDAERKAVIEYLKTL